MKKRLLTLIIALTALNLQASAWGVGRILGSESYVSVGALGGAGGLMFSGDADKPNKLGFTYGIGIDYTSYINNYIGFTTGIRMYRMSSGYYENNITSYGDGSLRVTDGTSIWNCDARYHLNTDRIDETYKTLFLEVPVMLAMQYRKWFWNVGLKVAVPVKMDCDYTYGESTLYLDENRTTGTVLTNPMRIKSYNGSSGSEDLYDKQRHQLLICYVMATAEVGYNVSYYNNGSSLSVGAFIDVSLNGAKINNAADAPTMSINSDELVYSNSVQSGRVNNVRCFKAGIRLQYNLGIGHGAKRSGRGLRYL